MAVPGPATLRGGGAASGFGPVAAEERGKGSNPTVRERIGARLTAAASGLKARLRKYFSGRLALVQLGGGAGALIVRSTAAYLASDDTVLTIVVASTIGSFAGYISAYVVGYWLAFRKDYGASGRSMPSDIAKLQAVEQLPNVGTVIGAAVTQGALISAVDMPPLLAVNIGSWFGPHRIVNLAAMLAGNSLKKAWVDGSWKPRSSLWGAVGGVRRALLGGPHSES